MNIEAVKIHNGSPFRIPKEFRVTNTIVKVQDKFYKYTGKQFTQWCEHHNREHRTCVPCGGSRICKHKKIQPVCIKCNGSQICEHGRVRAKCQPCGGSQYCEHGTRRHACRKCGGVSFCHHNVIKARCKKCKGSQICKHGNVNHGCKECGGSDFCSHGKRKKYCVACDGRHVCIAHKTTKCGTIGSNKFEGHCARCYSYLFPDKEISKNYRTKERAVVEYIEQQFPSFDMIANKKVPDGCSGKRPDIMFHFGSHIIVIEVDENQHFTYECEQRRMLEIMQDAGTIPSVFIRFNPDAYKQEDGTKVKSCWSLTPTGRITIEPKDKQRWTDRLNTLKKTLEKYIAETPKEFTVEYLYFDYDVSSRKSSDHIPQ